MSGIPPAPFIPYSANTVQIAAGGIGAASFAPNAIPAGVMAADAIGATAIATAARGQIKSIQRGQSTITGVQTNVTVPLSPAVDAAKTELRMLGTAFSGTASAFQSTHMAYVFLDPAGTSVHLARADATNIGTNTITCSWEVTERY
jgi:hypothetical protein